MVATIQKKEAVMAHHFYNGCHQCLGSVGRGFRFISRARKTLSGGWGRVTFQVKGMKGRGRG